VGVLVLLLLRRGLGLLALGLLFGEPLLQGLALALLGRGQRLLLADLLEQLLRLGVVRGQADGGAGGGQGVVVLLRRQVVGGLLLEAGGLGPVVLLARPAGGSLGGLALLAFLLDARRGRLAGLPLGLGAVAGGPVGGGPAGLVAALLGQSDLLEGL